MPTVWSTSLVFLKGRHCTPNTIVWICCFCFSPRLFFLFLLSDIISLLISTPRNLIRMVKLRNSDRKGNNSEQKCLASKPGFSQLYLCDQFLIGGVYLHYLHLCVTWVNKKNDFPDSYHIGLGRSWEWSYCLIFLISTMSAFFFK